MSTNPTLSGNDSMTDGDELVFLPLGGAGEIGMNLNLYGFGPPDRRQWIMVDLGVTFSDGDVPGVDVIMADPAFIEARRDDLLALILTHAHEDHIGAVAYLWRRLRCDVYATPFTAELVKGKLSEAGLLDEVPLHIVPLGGKLELGPFNIELITLTHSIPEPNALAIRTPLGNVLHTGDWKIDPDPLIGDVTNAAALKAFGDQGCRAMVCDSTNVFEPGESGSEAAVCERLMEIVGEQKGRVAITSFASNVARMHTAARVAAANDRHLVLIGRAMQRIMTAAKASGYLSDIPEMLTEYDVGYLPPEKVLLLVTGSQGEPRGALARIAAKDHRHIVLEAGDTVIFSSRVIPGNEESVLHIQNSLRGQRINIIDRDDDLVHVSGHPCRDELTQMYQWVRPEVAVPVHGEMKHLLEHADFTQSMQVKETVVAPNGSMVRLAPGRAEVVEHTPNGRLFLDGSTLVEEKSEALKERRKLAFAGHVVVSVVLDAAGQALASPRISHQGIPDFAEVGGMDSVVGDAVRAALSKVKKKAAHQLDDAAIAEEVRRAVRRAIRQHWGKRPITEILVTRLESE